MAFGDEDLVFMMADVFSVPVIYGAQSTRGFVDVADQLADQGEMGRVQYRSTILSIQTGSLTGLAEDSAIKVDGADYKVREFSKADDGKLTIIQIAEA